jgi:hypothetical protein
VRKGDRDVHRSGEDAHPQERESAERCPGKMHPECKSKTKCALADGRLVRVRPYIGSFARVKSGWSGAPSAKGGCLVCHRRRPSILAASRCRCPSKQEKCARREGSPLTILAWPASLCSTVIMSAHPRTILQNAKRQKVLIGMCVALAPTRS